MGLYWLLSDYGRSVARPLVALAASVGVYRWLYAQAFRPVLLKAMNEGALSLDQMHHYKAAVRSIALGNAVPFVGPLTIDADIKRFLFCALGSAEKLKDCIPTPPPGYQWLVLSQNLVSITLVFFLGLALRNYFKLK